MCIHFVFSDDSDMTGGPLKMFSEDVLTQAGHRASPKKMRVMEDNLSILSFPASNHSDDYMDYLGMQYYLPTWSHSNLMLP